MDRDALRLYFICGSRNAGDRPLHVIEESLKHGVTMFQLREKGANALAGEELFNFALDIKKLCRKYDVPFIINDEPDLAEKVGADGIHLGQDDMDIALLSPYFDDKIIGLSVRDRSELEQSDISKVDYIGTGPVFATGSKDDAGEAIGVEGLESMRGMIGTLPMVAIGGITRANYRECLDYGADGVSLISGIAAAKDTKRAVEGFL